MKKMVTLIGLTLMSFNALALDCNNKSYQEVLESSDFIYKGKLKKKIDFVNSEGFKEIKNEMEVIEVLKGEPDSYSVYTHKPEEQLNPDSYHYDYAASKQVKVDVEYYVIGKYNKQVFHGVCGGGIYKVDGGMSKYLK